MFSKDFLSLLPDQPIRVQAGASIKLRPERLLSQYLPGGTSRKKVAIAPARFDNYLIRGPQLHGNVKAMWGIAIDVDHPNKVNNGFFTKKEATQVWEAVPTDLQPYTWLLWSNGVSLWFMFEQEQTWEETARFAAKVGDSVQSTLRERGQPGEVENFYIGPNGLYRHANHCYRLPGSWASARKAYTETLTKGQKLPTEALQRYARDLNYRTPEFTPTAKSPTVQVSHTVLGNSGRGRGSSSNQMAFKAGLAAFRSGQTLIEVAKAHPNLTSDDLQKISTISAATGNIHRLPRLPDTLVIGRPLCAMQKRMQRHFTAIAWVGWINFYARMEKWSPKQTWDYIHNSVQHRQLSKILLKYWTYSQYEDDFHHCAQVFGNQAPSMVSIGVTCKVSAVYARLAVKSVRSVAKACGISKSTAARALAVCRGGGLVRRGVLTGQKPGRVLGNNDRLSIRKQTQTDSGSSVVCTQKEVKTYPIMPVGLDERREVPEHFTHNNVKTPRATNTATSRHLVDRCWEVDTALSVKTGLKAFKYKELQKAASSRLNRVEGPRQVLARETTKVFCRLPLKLWYSGYVGWSSQVSSSGP